MEHYSYGGEEFTCILVNADEDIAFVVAERMRTAIEKHKWPLRPITISAGLAVLRKDPQERSSLLSQIQMTGRRRAIA